MWALADVTHYTGQSILRLIHPNICVGGFALSVFVWEKRCTLSFLQGVEQDLTKHEKDIQKTQNQSCPISDRKKSQNDTVQRKCQNGEGTLIYMVLSCQKMQDFWCENLQ